MRRIRLLTRPFPFLFGGTFIEGCRKENQTMHYKNFPSFSEGLSLRVNAINRKEDGVTISLPFRRDFH